MITTKEQLTERAQVVSVFESSCALDYPKLDQVDFRLGLMKKLGPIFALKSRTARPAGPFSTEELRERAYLVRLYKAACRIDYPSVLEKRFLSSVTNRLRTGFALPESPSPQTSRPLCPHN